MKPFGDVLWPSAFHSDLWWLSLCRRRCRTGRKSPSRPPGWRPLLFGSVPARISEPLLLVSCPWITVDNCRNASTSTAGFARNYSLAYPGWRKFSGSFLRSESKVLLVRCSLILKQCSKLLSGTSHLSKEEILRPDLSLFALILIILFRCLVILFASESGLLLRANRDLSKSSLLCRYFSFYKNLAQISWP